jgi:dienelactone hydrolase
MKPRILLLPFFFMMSTQFLSAEIVGEPVDYVSGDTTCEGWHAYDSAVEGKRPSVLIVHQWTGLTDSEKMRAEMLAGLGYNVFALDIYGKGIRPQPPEAGTIAGSFKEDRALYRARLASGLEVLRGFPQTDVNQIAAIGYCFGGTGVLELARSGADIGGVVSFHGGLSNPSPEDAKAISCRVQVLHGADDPFVPAAEVEAFRDEMKAAGKEYGFVAYPGAVHAFTQKMAGDDPSKGAAYNAVADAKSWEEMKLFFVTLFGKG